MIVSCTRLAASMVAAGLLGPGVASAKPKKTRTEATVAIDADAVPDADTDGETEPSFAEKWRTLTPRRNMFEVGLLGGLWVPADDLELHFRNAPFRQYEPVSGLLGARVGYYPLRHFGFEGELAMMPTRTRSEQRAFVYSAKAHVVGQLGLRRLVPFVLVGGGVLAVRSEDDAAGDDADQAFHIGGGVKWLLSEHLQLRLEARDVMSPKRGRTINDPADSLEVLLGFSVLLGPRKKEEVFIPPDTDGDGFLDDKDKCVDEIGVAPDGCPVRDTDSDGFADDVDKCIDEPGVEPDGCPIPDTDGDGFLDPDDACPDEPGVAPDGCPLRDVDGDGLLPPADQCPEEPETRNGFQDGDGCPDELPEEIKKFTGVIEGIYFATNKATIRDTSKPTLDAAVKVLKDYPELRVEISGHTDAQGKDDKNLKLSADRAASVKAYLVSAGIAEDRIETRGAGETEPIGDNATKEGRQQNRRIEFKLLLPDAPTAPTPDAPAPDAPAADAPAADAPAADAPAADAPAADAPAADAPAADAPAADENGAASEDDATPKQDAAAGGEAATPEN